MDGENLGNNLGSNGIIRLILQCSDGAFGFVRQWRHHQVHAAVAVRKAACFILTVNYGERGNVWRGKGKRVEGEM